MVKKLKAINYFFSESLLIKAIRKIHNLSQQEFCQLLGYSQSALSKIENGLISPDLKFIVGLSNHLGIDLNIFRYGHIPKIPPQCKANVHKNFIGSDFTQNGSVSTKTVFTFVELIRQHYKKDIYQALNIPEEIFCLSFLKYNLTFFQAIAKHVPVQLWEEIVTSYTPNGTSEFDEVSFKNYLTNNRILSFTHVQNANNIFKAVFNGKATTLEMPIDYSLLILLVQFDLMVTFNIPLTIKCVQKQRTTDCEIVLYA